MKHIGIDIGTSSICGVVYDESAGQVRSVTKANDAAIGGWQGKDIPAWAFRRDATLRGRISGIDLRNLTPDRLTTAFMQGITQELKDFYDLLPESIKKDRTAITGSGNALRKNPLLQKILSGTFGLPVVLTSHEEEAALGAAIAYKA